jgi:hypothetical protein
MPSAGKAKGDPLVAKGGGNLVPNGGGNLVPNGGGNLVPNGGGNLVPNGGGNVVSNGGSTIVAKGGGNLVDGGGVHAAFASQLRDLAAIGHNRAAAQILTNNAAGVVSNNAGRIIATNGAGLIANNAGNLVSNNSGGIIANNGGQAVSNNGASFRLAQLAAPAFSIEPAEGETASPETPLPDGTIAIAFDKADGSRRLVVMNAAHRPLEQQRITGAVLNAAGVMLSGHTERTLVYGNDQRPRGFLAYDETYDEAGRLLTLTHQPSEILEPNSGLKIVVQALELAVEPPSGRFEVRFEHLGAVEKGTLTNVVRNVGGRGVGVELADPLATMGGESRFESTDGRLLFERRSELLGQEHRLVLTLRDGYALDVRRADRKAPYEGIVAFKGTPVGKARLTTGADAAVTYEVTFDGATSPFTVRIPDAAPAAATP